jgi:membrane-associated phospholipid phosphatase
MSDTTKLTTPRTYYTRQFFFQVVLFSMIFLLAVLLILVKQYPYFVVDLIVTRSIQSISWNWFDSWMRLISDSGETLWGGLITLALGTALYWKNKTLESSMLFISVSGAVIISQVIKFIIGRPRPSADLIQQIGSFARHDSFPSGHVMFFVGLYGFLLFLTLTRLKKSWLQQVIASVFVILIVGIGLSRIYVGAHWFSDVLGAYMIGGLWMAVIIQSYNRLITTQKLAEDRGDR